MNDILKSIDVVCLGEALIDFVALETGVGVGDASGFLKAPGGAPANVAVAMARLGGSSAFIGKVGNDPFGNFLHDTFAGAGVDTSGMLFDETHRTGLAFVSLQKNGERDFVFFRNPSADMLLTPNELDVNLIESAKIFHFGSITQICEPVRSATMRAVEVAREAHALISYDPNLRPPLWSDLNTARAIIRNTIPLVDICKVSDEELVFLTGQNDIDLGMEDILTLAPELRLLTVTTGAEGCVWVLNGHKTGIQRLSGYRVDTVDTTGAGDGFMAGLLIRLASKSELDPSSDWRATFAYANAVGALTTTIKGAIPALPDALRVNQFLEEECARSEY